MEYEIGSTNLLAFLDSLQSLAKSVDMENLVLEEVESSKFLEEVESSVINKTESYRSRTEPRIVKAKHDRELLKSNKTKNMKVR